MPSNDDRSVLVPLRPMAVSEVPRAGLQELTEFKGRRVGLKTSFLLWTVFAGVSALISAYLADLGPIAYGAFLLMALVCIGFAGRRYVQMAAGQKSWQALPEGASETTAQLEDATAKSIRGWNEDVGQWNKTLMLLEVDAARWRRRSEDPSSRPEGWSQEAHAMDGDTLLACGQTLVIERKGLEARRRKIERTIRLLDARMRAAQEPDDPENE